MATVTAKLTLTSSDLLTDALALASSTDITAFHTSGMARKKITSTAIGNASGQVTIDTADVFGSPSYIYIKNTAAFAADGTGTIYCFFVGPDGTDRHEIQIPGSQFAFIPASSDSSLKAYTATSGTIVEFMVFGTQA